MRILMISPMYPSKRDPVYGTFVQTYFEKFREYNGEKQTYSIFIRGRGNGIVSKTIKYSVFYTQILLCLLVRKYDLIYVHTISTTIPPIKIASKFRCLNLVFNIHGTDIIPVKKVGVLLKNLAIPELYKAKQIVLPSEYFKTVLLSMLPDLKEDRIFVSASGGIDVEKFSPASTYVGRFTLGFVSRIDLGKGWDTFLLLIERLAQSGIKVKGIIAGRGGEEDAMRRMIQEKRLSGYIDYLGPVKHDDLPKVFNRMDLFVFPTTRSESLGLVGIEALACGVPVVGSNIAALPGYIQGGVNGYLFEPGKVVSLQECVIRFLYLSEIEKKEMARNARLSALKYDTNVVMQELYQRMTGIIAH